MVENFHMLHEVITITKSIFKVYAQLLQIPEGLVFEMNRKAREYLVRVAMSVPNLKEMNEANSRTFSV
jgi:hypothetical protein